MSHRITMEQGKQIQMHEQELRQMQKAGLKLPKSRRQKKYEITRRRQDGILWRLIDRIERTGGKMPKHLKTLEATPLI